MMGNESGDSPEKRGAYRSPINFEWCRRHDRRQGKLVQGLRRCTVRDRARRGRFSGLHDRGNIDN